MEATKQMEPDSNAEILPSEILANCDTIIGTGCMRSIIEDAKHIAQSNIADGSVLVEAESGTGKQLFAHWIHRWSPRHAMPFTTIDCATMSEAALRLEIFGSEHWGKYHGTDQTPKGREGQFELAKVPTLYQ